MKYHAEIGTAFWTLGGVVAFAAFVYGVRLTTLEPSAVLHGSMLFLLAALMVSLSMSRW